MKYASAFTDYRLVASSVTARSERLEHYGQCPGAKSDLLETLANFPEGCALTSLAEAGNMPASAAHRLLAELSRYGYIRQERDHGR